MTLKKLGAIALGGGAATLILVQALRSPRRWAPDAGALTAPPEVITILKNSCYDCHSNQTQWPWYGRVPPLSWWISREVELGRRQVNFSDWAGYYPITKQHKLQWIGRSVRESNMPPLPYRLMHPAARLTEGDRRAIEQWVEAELAHQ
jgi:hypothetical protein